MQNDQIYSEIQTKEDFKLVNNELDLLESGLYKKGKASFEEILAGSIRKSTANMISNLLTIKNQKEVITELKNQLAMVKFMELTISFEPSTKTINKISSLVKSSISPNIALDIKIDKEIIGGAVISYNGKYLDFSLKKKLEEVLKNYA